MKVAITGGTGFLGLNMIKLMVEKGWQVRALHRPGSNLEDIKTLPVDLVAVDFSDQTALSDAIPSDLDAIFHVAGDTSLWSRNNERQFQTNVTLTQWLVDIAIEKRVRRFIQTSSISAYGFHDKTIDETSESHALTSGVNYLKTKFEGEQVVKAAVLAGTLDAVILNPCGIIGPYDRHNWSQLFFMINEDTLPGIPPGEGSYCHVTSVAEAHINAFFHGRTGENYILAGVDLSFKQLVDKIGSLLSKRIRKRVVPAWVLRLLGKLHLVRAAVTGNEPAMTPEKALMVTKRVVATCDKAKAELAYDADVSIDRMLQDCYDWLKSERLI